jgi:hypothetical protein
VCYESPMSWLTGRCKRRDPPLPEDEPCDGYAFRMRLLVPTHRNVPHGERELRLSLAEDVRLVAQRDAQKIDGENELALVGRGYASYDQAAEAGRRWRGLFERGAAVVQLGVDFGDRRHGGGIGGEYQQQLERELDRPVIYNNYGLQVFEGRPWPRFVKVSLDFQVGAALDVFSEAVETARQLDLRPSEREVLAYDLYAASFFTDGPDSRFLMLMLALEALIDQQRRPSESVAHVDALIKLTEESALSHGEIESMVGSLKWLRQESINQAGKALAATLGERHYMEKTPEKFFTSCYELRSHLVHGEVPRPSGGDLESHAAALVHFVADLLSGELRNAVDVQAITAARPQAMPT